MKNLVNSSYFRIVLLVLVVATLGLLLKKYSSTREKFNVTFTGDYSSEPCENILEQGSISKHGYDKTNEDYFSRLLYCRARNTTANTLTPDNKKEICKTCEIKTSKINDVDVPTACERPTENETTEGCTGFVGFRCGVCDKYYKDKTDKGNWIIDNDTDYNEQVRECSKERIGGTAEADDGCPATMQPPESGNTGTTSQDSESNNESTSAETTTVSSFSQSLINFKNVLNQKLGGDPVSISSNNVNSTSDIVNKLEELLQESTIEEVNSFKNFSYNNGITTPLPLDPGFEPLTGGNTLAEYSDYQRFL